MRLFLAVIFGGLIAFAACVVGIRDACDPDSNIEVHQPQPNWGKGDKEDADQRTHAAQENGDTTQAAPGLNPADAPTQASKPDSKKSKWEKESWWGKFFCEMKLTDIAIAFFTYCLVVVGAFQIKRTEYVMRESERAHVFAGPDDKIVTHNGTRIVAITAINTGRSPAIMKAINASFYRTEPGYWFKYPKSATIDFDLVIKGNDVVPPPSRPTINTADPADTFIAGYVAYTDIFQRFHTSRFCVRLDGDRYTPSGPRWMNVCD